MRDIAFRLCHCFWYWLELSPHCTQCQHQKRKLSMILAILAELIVKSGNCFQRSYFIFWWILTVQLGALADQWTIVANEDSPGNNLCGLTEWQPFAKQFHTQWAGGPYWQKIMDVYFWQGTRQVNSITVVLEAYAVQAWGLLFIWAKWTPVSLCFFGSSFQVWQLEFPSRLTLIPWIGRNVYDIHAQKWLSQGQRQTEVPFA